jgi:NAD(P)H-hydrate epimerase
MKVVTAAEMQAIDRRTIKHCGIPSLVLMERAGVAVTNRVIEHFSPKRVTILAGSGNNGGDGLVVARELFNRGISVKALIVGKRDKLSPDCKHQYETAKKMGVDVRFRTRPDSLDLHGALVVDAIFGTGLKKDIKGAMADTIQMVNASGCPVLAVDMASGVSSDTGQVLGIAVEANATVTFGAPKRGHLLHPGAGHTGKLYVEDIGFPQSLFEKLKCSLLTKDDMALLLPERPSYSHKGYYGHVLLVAGSRGKTGAALMAARAALRTGAGLITIGIPEHLTGSFQSSVVEEMLLPLPDAGDGALSYKALDAILEFLGSQADVLAMGPGLGRAAETSKLVRELILRSAAPMVVDADALNALEDKTTLLKKTKAPVIITPHPGEFARLTGMGIRQIESERVEAALQFSRKTGAYLILKGAPTVVAEPGGDVFINSTGNPGMAKAGTGDVLTGMTAGLLGQGLSPIDAALLGVYMHGLAGDISAQEVGEQSLLASDMIEAIPESFEEIINHNAK